MAEPAPKETNVIVQRRNEFVMKMDATAYEIKEKFDTYHTQLFRKEASLLEPVYYTAICNYAPNPRLIQFSYA